MNMLAQQHCQPTKRALTVEQLAAQLSQLPGWTLHDGQLCKSWSFADFHRTMAFVNTVAELAHEQNHHPDMEVGYDRCQVRWSTHDAGGISQNDLICAARLDALCAGREA